MLSPRTIGFYGGSFNPIHFGHLNLAIQLLEQGGLEAIWFCPAGVNPLRTQDPLIAAEHRLKMVELAIEDIPAFKVLDVECRRPGPSYTVDTLRQLVAEEGSRFRLLLGNDALDSFSRWREPETIIDLAPPLVGHRQQPASSKAVGSSKIVQALEKGLVPIPIMEISSTDIRNRLASGLYCGHLVPAKVLDYIFKHGLY